MGKEIVVSFIERNEDFINSDERIAVVRIVCQHMVQKNLLQYYPSTETKHLYAAAIVKAFPCLVTKIQHPQGKMEINHDVYFHPQAGGFIENHLKEMRRRDGVHKRKPNNKQAQSSGSDDTPKRKNKKKGFWMKRHSSSSIEYSTKIYQYMEKTFEHRQRQSLNIFKSASDVLNEYPRFMDVDNVALIIRDFQAKYPHITDSTFRKRFVDKLSSSLLLLARSP
ncbi:Uncharacterized protein APZ42_028822 [Daphnia magna]|uniref:Uncharacterized protein n=1 Tax=Daphnia magna TaxID=35525 RepID=A0A164Q5G6_9CRUS|nr:Uncharacterized protein APZ42_028822 [Daphnia magna]